MNASDVLCGAGTFITTLSVVSQMPEANPWIQLLVGVISALIFAVVNIGGKILTSWLEKKGIISKEHKKHIDDTLDDLGDDGQINGSNKDDTDFDKK